MHQILHRGIKIQLNRSIKGLEGQLKIRVMAGDFNATLTALKRLESRLPDGASMAQINSRSVFFVGKTNIT
jgi:hypothetical protein